MTPDTDTDFESTFDEVISEVPDEAFDRSRFVPGDGPLDAALMLVGEAPGEQEVEQEEPFVGKAGGRLNSILDTIDIERGDLYITNLVKVRPPDNRDPHREEIEIWRPVLDAEIEHVDPVAIVTLGNVATRELLDTDEGISDIHGKSEDRDDYAIVPTYHPAATFYDDSAEQAIEEDIRVASEIAGFV
jgi:uracil-DNA glycosylase family 4